MGKFYEAGFKKGSDGLLIMNQPRELERMTMAGAFQRGYKQLTHIEFQTAGIKHMENGFAVLKNAHGELRAVRYVEGD